MSEQNFRALVDVYLRTIRDLVQVPRTLAEPALYGALSALLNGFLSEERPGAAAVHQARTDYGIPDFVIDAGGVLGYVEAKRPSVDLDNLRGRDRQQQESFRNLPNLLYTNYLDFQLLEEGELAESASLGGPELLDPRRPAEPSAERVRNLRALLVRFVSHRLTPPRSVQELAHALARATRVLRDATATSLQAVPNGAVAELREEWKALLFEEATDAEFADAYAQTVSYGFLTARLELDGELTEAAAIAQLDRRHPFLGAALRLLTNPRATEEIGWALRVVLETLQGVSQETFARSRHPDDPLLYFYEDFLAEYDPKLRKHRGVYYTPASVVGFQVRAVAELLSDLGRERLLADDVVALDPGAGTGTYLLDLLDETAASVRTLDGEAAVPAAMARAARNLNGFEILVGPYTVAHQRLGVRLAQLGAGEEPVRMFLVDTLAEPGSVEQGQLRFGIFERQLSEERARADEVKRTAPVRLVLGNPPYERAKGRREADWLQRKMSLFTGPVRRSARVNLKNLADPYVHFFRWGLWKLFESVPPAGPRLLTFISNRSYLGGDAFEGMRLALRQRFDEVWVVDLEGERRGPLATENIFDVRVGVAIIVCLRRDATAPSERDALVRYVRITGTREEKEGSLKGSLSDLEWTVVERGGGEPFLPGPSPTWLRWPALDELMPFRQSGVQTKRDALAVGPTAETLMVKLRAFGDPDLSDEERRRLFHETRDRRAPAEPAIDPSRLRRYGYRPLDVRWLYNDPACIDFPRPKLQRYWHEGQRAFCTLPKGHGPGPAVVLQTELPDLHAYRGSFGGHVFPLWLDPEHSEPNLAPGFLRLLRNHLHAEVEPLDIFAYVFGVLHAPSYQPRFAEGLEQGFPRIPFPVETEAFRQMASLGRQLLDAHELPPARGNARLTGVPGPLVERPSWEEGRLKVAAQALVEPVSRHAWDFRMSGYPVLERWIRDRARAGLDLSRDYDLVDQLLRVIDAVETTVRLGPKLDSALEAILTRETLRRESLLPLDLRRAVDEFARVPGALEEAAREAEAWDALSDDAFIEAEGR